MNKLLSGLMAASLAASFAIGSAIPVNAAPVFVPNAEPARTDVVKVHNPWRNNWRAERRYNRWARRHAWRDRYYYRGDPYYAYRPRYYYSGDPYYAYRPRYYYARPYYGGYYYPRYYRQYRPGVTLEFNF